MNALRHFPNNKNTTTIHIQNLLTKINTHLNETTRTLRNFNDSLNNFIATASSKDLHPKPTAKTITNFIQKMNESPHHEDTFLNIKFKNDSSLFVLLSALRTNTQHTTTFVRCSKKTAQPVYTNTNNIKHKRKRNSLYKRILLLLYHDNNVAITSLFSLQNKNASKTQNKVQPTIQHSIMPPSPINLSFSTDQRTPVLEPLIRKPSPFVSTPKSATEKLFVSPTNRENSTSPKKATSINLATHEPDPAPVTKATIPISHPLSTPGFKDILNTIPCSIVYSSDTIYLLCQLRRGKDDTLNNALAGLHNDGSALRFIETLITASFLARPTTSDLHVNLRIRQIKYEQIRNLTPTYSISFGSLYNETDKDRTYACHGTPKLTCTTLSLNAGMFKTIWT